LFAGNQRQVPSLFHPGEPGFRRPPPSWGPDCGSYASLASQHHPSCGVLSHFTLRSGELFSALWAIRVACRRFWPTVTRERYYRGCFVLFCGGEMVAAAVFSPLWPTITLRAGVKAGRRLRPRASASPDPRKRPTVRTRNSSAVPAHPSKHGASTWADRSRPIMWLVAGCGPVCLYGALPQGMQGVYESTRP